MNITPPFAYQEIVPLAKDHRVAMPATGKVPAAFRDSVLIPLSYSEISLACHDYPIIFVSADQGKTATAMAVLGLKQGQNLYLAADDAWDRNAYQPAYVRRYPYCMTRVNDNGKERDERIVCVEKRALSDTGMALHNDKGEPLPAWENLRKFLFEFETDLGRTEAMCKMVVELELLEPFTMQAKSNQGEPITLSGMYRVIENKLPELPAEKLKELVKNGVLPRLYAHLMLMSNFAKLLARAQAKTGA
ncbi:MAG: SapC family protein [Betaproteobacteria bacterium]|nr:SapC family protein [Betaproteobacteria bacterium]